MIIVMIKMIMITMINDKKVAVLTMACLVFLGAFIAVLCICCIKMKR